MSSPAQAGNTKFTVLIRLPFPRGDFVDPPPVEWDAAKDQALWDILSRPSKSNDIDWKALAENFDVTLQFLLQQAAWLYHRQLSQVRAQMRRVGTTHSNTASPAPSSIYASTALGQPVKAGQGIGTRAPSRLASQPKEAVPVRAPIPRRTSSGNTVQQIKAPQEPSHAETPTLETREPRWDGHSRRPSTGRREHAPPATAHKSPTLAEKELVSSSSDSNSDDDIDAANRRKGFAFKRFGRFSTHRPGLQDDDDNDYDDDDDESPAFLPLSGDTGSVSHGNSGHDLSATLRMGQERVSATQRRATEPPQSLRKSITAESSGSSVSSGVAVTHSQTQRRRQFNQPSPPRAAEVARMSPRRSTTSGRDISDGTPSMGSSFSDLDGV
ncbi:multidomain presynaptic cytomatrix related protein [Aspergillus lucknowensis]|uniref:Autophagy-related protein 29 n=1 Tax=Aspergillus lucknowensis TaxID=176173 RepID=A0ABR4LSC7_9EURO